MLSLIQSIELLLCDTYIYNFIYTRAIRLKSRQLNYKIEREINLILNETPLQNRKKKPPTII